MTRNPRVSKIYLVDPEHQDEDGGRAQVVWDRSKGDGEDPFEPRGKWASFITSILPKEYIPMNWKKYDNNN